MTIKFWSDCRNNQILQAPQFTQSSYSTNLFTNKPMFFTWPTYSIPSCASYFTTTLINAITSTQTTQFIFMTHPSAPYFLAKPTAHNPWVTSSPWKLRVSIQDGFGHSS